MWAWPAPARKLRFASLITSENIPIGNLSTTRVPTRAACCGRPTSHPCNWPDSRCRTDRMGKPGARARMGVHSGREQDLAVTAQDLAVIIPVPSVVAPRRANRRRIRRNPSKYSRTGRLKKQKPHREMRLFEQPKISVEIYTLKDDPHPHVLFTFGFSNLKPAPSRVST